GALPALRCKAGRVFRRYGLRRNTDAAGRPGRIRPGAHACPRRADAIRKPGPVLKIRRIPIDTHPENTAFLLRRGNGYSAEQYQALRKLRIWSGPSEILATLALVDDETIVGPGEIGLGEQAVRRLGLPGGGAVAIAPARPPASLEDVKRQSEADQRHERETR